MSMMETVEHTNKIVLVYLAHPRISRSGMEKDITELWNLVASLGDAAVVDIIAQKGPEFPATYIGTGKVAEVAEYLTAHPVHVILFNGRLKPGQKFTLRKKYWGIRPDIGIWDRVDLILAIFSRHAHTTQAKLQIELARMRLMGPSLYGMGKVLSRQGGGIGTQGLGETNTELMKRHWQRETKRITDELAKTVNTRKRQMEHRKRMGLQTISLVGYTGAGKTSLFNLLTHKHHAVEHVLFTTLDSTVGEIFMPALGKQVVISDTIGFIGNLPPDLIDAFTSTLLESVHADLVLHVIDASDRDMSEKIDVVHGILKELNIAKEKVALVYNKIDAAPIVDRKTIAGRFPTFPSVFVSAKTGEGIETILNSVVPRLIPPAM